MRNKHNEIQHKEANSLNTIVLFIGIGLLLFLAFIVCISSLWSFLDFSPYLAITIIAFISAIIVTRLILNTGIAETVSAALCIVVLIMISLFVSSLFVDISYDGNSYHKLAVVSFYEGWNPLHESVSTMDHFAAIDSMNHELWIDHYSQGIWRIAAGLYALTGVLESAKAYTLLIALSASFVLGSYLNCKGLKGWQCFLIGLVSFFNPIVIAQFVTFYVDASLMMALMLLIIGMIALNDKACKGRTSVSIVIVIGSFVLCCATKFTGLAYAAVFLISFWVLYIIQTKKSHELPSSLSIASLTWILFFMTIFVVIVLNYSPYVTNFIDHGNPLYPLKGEGAVDIITPQTPKEFADKPAIVQILMSIFSEASNANAASKIATEMRLPLAFTQDELTVLKACDLRASGFGVLYSFIFMLLVVGTIWSLIVSKKRYRLFFTTYVTFLIPMICMMLLLEGGWWARYSSYCYFTTIFVLVFLFLEWNRKKRTYGAIVRAWALVLLVSICINSLFFLQYNTAYVWDVSREVEEGINDLRIAVNNGQELYIKVTSDSGQLYLLEEQGIDYSVVKQDSEEPFEPDGQVSRLSYDLRPKAQQ